MGLVLEQNILHIQKQKTFGKVDSMFYNLRVCLTVNDVPVVSKLPHSQTFFIITCCYNLTFILYFVFIMIINEVI